MKLYGSLTSLFVRAAMIAHRCKLGLKRFWLGAMIFSSLAASSPALGKAMCGGRPKIQRDQIDMMFKTISEGSGWDMSQPMLWGYFFTDNRKSDLEKAQPRLETLGYRFAEIHFADSWWLHVERTETHTPQSLYERNEQLYEFARINNISCYDGMDVGPAPARPLSQAAPDSSPVKNGRAGSLRK